MKYIILAIGFIGLVSSHAQAGNFYVQDVPGLQTSVDKALLSGGKIAYDTDGRKYTVVSKGKIGSCIVGYALDAGDNVAEVSICPRSMGNFSQKRTTQSHYQQGGQNQMMTPAQQVQYQRASSSTPSRQSYGGWFSQKPGLQYDLRGNPNAPFMAIEPLRVNPNDLYNMSPQQRKETLDFVQRWNSEVVPQAGANDRMYGQNGQVWMGETNRDRYPGQGALETADDAVDVMRNLKDLFRY